MSDPAGKKGKTAVRLPENLGDILAGGLGASLKDSQNLQTHIKRIVESMTANMPPAFKAAVAPKVGLPSPESFNCLRSVAMLMKFQLDPSSVDERRGKKRSCFTADQALLRTCAIDAFRLNKIEYIMPWLEKAVVCILITPDAPGGRSKPPPIRPHGGHADCRRGTFSKARNPHSGRPANHRSTPSRRMVGDEVDSPT